MVFNPIIRQWIKPEAASTLAIIEQVKKCPSGALTYLMNDMLNEVAEVRTERIVEIIPNGPLLVYGNILVKDRYGLETKKDKATAFCGCGASGNKPIVMERTKNRMSGIKKGFCFQKPCY